MQKTCNRESYALFPRERIVPTSGGSIGLYFKTDRKLNVLKNYIQSRKGETKSLFIGHGLPLNTKYYKQLWTVVVSNWLTYIMLSAFNLVLCLLKAIKVIAILFIIMIAVFHSLCLSAQTPRKDSGVEGLETVTPIGVDYYVPEQFWEQQLKVYSNGDTSIISMVQYKGKPLIIDFWSLSCVSCITKFPKLFELQNKFQGNINILLINKEGKDAIHRMPNDFLRDNNLSTVYDDYFLNELFPHRSIPHYIWITPRGRVSAITSAEFVNAQWVAGFIDNCFRYEMPN